MSTERTQKPVGRKVFGGDVDDWLAFYTRKLGPLDRRMAVLFSWAVVAAVAFAHWFVRWPLGDGAAVTPDDTGFSPLQPILWAAVAALAGYVLLRLHDRTRLHLLLAVIAAAAGVFHVIVFIVTGVVTSFTESVVVVEILDFPRNIIHVLTFVAAAELARAVLFDVWQRWNRNVAFVAVTGIFFVTTLTAAQHSPWGSLEELRAVVGSVWIPALAISLLATSLVEMGGPIASFGYRFVVLGFLWLWSFLPDMQWYVAAAVGAAAPWAAWRIINAVYRRTREGKEHVGPPGERPRSRITPIVVGIVVMSAIIVAGLVLVFGTGFVGYRTQIVDDTTMEPDYQVGDVVLVREDVTPRTLDVDDVVIVRVSDESLIRRIVAILGTGDEITFVTQGDAQTRPDPPVGAADIAGEVIVRIPDIGHPVLEWRD